MSRDRNRRLLTLGIGIGIGVLALVATGCAPSQPPIMNPTAPANVTDDPVGQWGEIADGEPHLTISDDGTMTGHDGCNGIGGRWELEAGVVQFTETYMTLIMCEGMDAWLSSLRTAVSDGGTISIRGEGGDVIGVLPRVDGE